MSAPVPEIGPPSRWQAFVALFGVVSAVLVTILYGFVLAQDPYGRRVRPGYPPTPIMDANQRFMYPQLARSGLYDAAVFGTSTARLLEPRRLGKVLGGRFANLAINAGTPWEQLQLAGLFVRHAGGLRTIVMGLDRAWCDPDADQEANRVTYRAFPPWLYDENRVNDLPHLLNLKSLEISGRVALNRLGLMKARIRPDGYEVFTPPEAAYDLDRVRLHLRSGVGDRAPGDFQPASAADRERAARSRRPAVDWLAAFAGRLPAATRLVVLFPPLHILGQPVPESRGAVEDEACKTRIAAALGERRATVVDYRWPSALTRADENFWDKLHYRLPVAAAIVDELGAAVDGKPAPPDAPYRVLLPGP